MAGYNLIIKAADVEDAKTYVEDWLCIPTVSAAPLGYNEIIVSIANDDPGIAKTLADWHQETRPTGGDPFDEGALIWWKGDE